MNRCLTRQRGQQWPLRPAQEETMIQFTYKLKLNELVRDKVQSPPPL